MTWFTWRRHRVEAVVAAALLVLIGGMAIAYSLSVAALPHCGVDVCGGSPVGWTWFSGIQPAFGGVAILAPAVLGAFVGAPLLAREAEWGTGAIAWTQGITRRRWTLTTLGLVAGSVTVAAAVLAAAVWTWFRAFRIGGWGSPYGDWYAFDIAPPVVVAYSIFALALGIAAGAAIRRTVPAMFTTLVGYALVRVPIASALRPLYVPAVVYRQPLLTTMFPFNNFGQKQYPAAPWESVDSWSLGSSNISADGHPISDSVMAHVSQACSGGWLQPPGQLLTGPPGCAGAARGIYVLTAYQPASRFWFFQGVEAAIFVVLAAALLALAHRLVMRLR